MNSMTYIHIYDGDQIECRHSLSAEEPDGFPMLELGGGLVIFPTRGRLERLAEVVRAYLAAHPGMAVGVEVGANGGA